VDLFWDCGYLLNSVSSAILALQTSKPTPDTFFPLHLLFKGVAAAIYRTSLGDEPPVKAYIKFTRGFAIPFFAASNK